MQEYKNNRIIVRFNEYLCGHAGECVRGLPVVFEPSKDPWIDVNAASPEGYCRSHPALPHRRVGMRPD
ncbi:(4Fe-4S)-binding protein [Methylomagnum sp.]